MNAFSVMGPNAASWKPVEGKHPIIFGVDDNLDCHTMTGADISGGPGSTAQGGNMLLITDYLFQQHITRQNGQPILTLFHLASHVCMPRKAHTYRGLGLAVHIPSGCVAKINIQ
jgi:hypothetical protein